MNQLLWTRPELWPFLLLLPGVWFAVWALLRRARAGIDQYGAVFTERATRPSIRASVVTAIVACLLLTWMDPLYGEEQVAVERQGLDVIFCLDTSRSMLARDVEPYRLARAKRDMRSLLPELVGGDRVGLVCFAGQAKLVVPLTHDLDSFDFLLDEVDTQTVRKGGTDLAAALRKALKLTEEGFEQTTVIVMLTDGEDLGGAGRQAAQEVAQKGIVLHTIGYGSTRGSKITLEKESEESFLADDKGKDVVSILDVDGLRKMSRAAGGEFLRCDVVALPLVELKRKRMDPMLKRAYDAGEETLHQTRFQWALLPAVILLLIEVLLRGGRRR